MLTTSKLIKDLRQEYHAQKAAFERSASNISLYTKSINFATSRNEWTFYDQGGTFTSNEPERVVVTLATNTGSNTLAKLEIATDGDTPIVRRVPFSGGAKWIVTAPAKTGTWAATNYQFVVQTLVNGTLTAKMIWE